MNLQDKIKGALYGFAIGDAMGATTEFMDENKIKEKYGIVKDVIGGGWLDIIAGDVTDDTEMSMCVMDILMEQDYLNFKHNLAVKFVEWLKSDPKDVGNQCFKAIRFYEHHNEYIYVDRTALGNGSLMRALPCALLNDERAQNLNILQGEITHNNDICSNIIKDYTQIIQDRLYDRKSIECQCTLMKPTGYVINTFNNVKYWSNQPTFESCIIGAVNHGGDADTIAAIAGSIAGAKFGYEAIPKDWVDSLNEQVKQKLSKFSEFVMQTYEN